MQFRKCKAIMQILERELTIEKYKKYARALRNDAKNKQRTMNNAQACNTKILDSDAFGTGIQHQILCTMVCVVKVSRGRIRFIQIISAYIIWKKHM